VFRACPYVDEVLVIDIKDLIKKPFLVFSELRKRKADVVLDFDQWLRISPLLAFMSGAACRYGFKTVAQYRHYAYTGWVEHGRGVHEIDNFLKVLKLVGIENADRELEFIVNGDAQKKAEQVLDSIGISKARRFVVFHPETPAHGGQRQWPAENYVQLGKRLIAQEQVDILVSGTAKDWESNRKIVSEIGTGALVLPPVSLQEYAAVLNGSAVMVCGNTGVMHLACALKVPVVALHGPTEPAQWGPSGENFVVIKSRLRCSPCLYLGFEYGCSTNRCMRAISVDEVFDAVEGLIAKSLQK
jgi:heptosyltransferase I